MTAVTTRGRGSVCALGFIVRGLDLNPRASAYADAILAEGFVLLVLKQKVQDSV